MQSQTVPAHRPSPRPHSRSAVCCSAAARTCRIEPKFFPQRGTDFYADGRSVRPQVENTVARNQLHADTYFYTGLVNGKEGDGCPFPSRCRY